MEIKNYAYRDSSGKEHVIDLDSSSFDFAQKEKKISDVKFKEKPVTFARDAWIRFGKNKSSIVAMIILGVLTLSALILPLALPFDVSSVHADEIFLSPKLFPAGSGFWDGTKNYSDVIYDEASGYPDSSAKLNNDAIIMDTMKVYEGYTSTAYSYSKGGYIRVGNSSSEYSSYFSTPSIELAEKENLTLSFHVEDALDTENYASSSYSVTFLSDYASLADTESEDSSSDYAIIVNNSEEYGDISIDVTSLLSDFTSGSLYFLVPPIEDVSTAVFIKDVSLKSGDTTLFSISDASSSVYNGLLTFSGSDVSLYNASVKYCSFLYDTYEATYGEKTMTIGETTMKEYINKGYCAYNFNAGPSSFKMLDDRCPVRAVYSQSQEEGLISVINLECTVSYYRYLGYSSMPIHLFGTNAMGKDMLKYVAEGTRNSLGLGIIISAITFVFGLIYGSIEGYFGGTADLIMERIVDILGYIPTIVLITLCVLHFGQTFGVFIFAMCLTGWIGTSSITRTQFYRFKKREYVLASRSLGASDKRLIFTHILPNSLGTIVTSSVLMIPSVIFSEASVSYLGIGLKGLSSLGVILSDSQKYISTYSYILVFPSVVLALMMICFNLFGNGLRDALNPSLKGSD